MKWITGFNGCWVLFCLWKGFGMVLCEHQQSDIKGILTSYVESATEVAPLPDGHALLMKTCGLLTWTGRMRIPPEKLNAQEVRTCCWSLAKGCGTSPWDLIPFCWACKAEMFPHAFGWNSSSYTKTLPFLSFIPFHPFLLYRKHLKLSLLKLSDWTALCS